MGSCNTFRGGKRSAKRGEGAESEREEKDVTVQSAPSAQRLRCGLAPSSQSQPDPHIAFIYLWKGVSGGCVMGNESKRQKLGAGDRGGGGGGGGVVGGGGEGWVGGGR